MDMEQAVAAVVIVTDNRGAAESMVTMIMASARTEQNGAEYRSFLFPALLKGGRTDLFLRGIGLRDTITLPQMEAGGRI